MPDLVASAIVEDAEEMEELLSSLWEEEAEEESVNLDPFFLGPFLSLFVSRQALFGRKWGSQDA